MVITNLLLAILIVMKVVEKFRTRKILRESKSSMCDVKNICAKVSEDKMPSELKRYSEQGYRLCSSTYSGYSKTDKCHYYTLFFTKYSVCCDND